MITLIAIFAGVVLGYGAGALFLPASSGGGFLQPRYILAVVGGLIGAWGGSLLGSRPLVWEEVVAEVRTEEDLEALLARSAEEPVLLDFYASWCPPCRMTAPNVNELAREGRAVAVVDVDRSLGIANRFEVGVLPTVVVLRNGEEAARSVGYHSAAALRKLLEGEG
jgi:thioredoxin